MRNSNEISPPCRRSIPASESLLVLGAGLRLVDSWSLGRRRRRRQRYYLPTSASYYRRRPHYLGREMMAAMVIIAHDGSGVCRRYREPTVEVESGRRRDLTMRCRNAIYRARSAMLPGVTR